MLKDANDLAAIAAKLKEMDKDLAALKARIDALKTLSGERPTLKRAINGKKSASLP